MGAFDVSLWLFQDLSDPIREKKSCIKQMKILDRPSYRFARIWITSHMRQRNLDLLILCSLVLPRDLEAM